MYFYKVAGNTVGINIPKRLNFDTELPAYLAFKIDSSEIPEKDITLLINTVSENSLQEIIPLNCITTGENDLGCWKLYELEEEYCIDLAFSKGLSTHRMICDKKFKNCKVDIKFNEPYGFDALNSFILMAFAISCTWHNTITIHASVTMLDDYAYAFIGSSGTGKSTHSQLWLKYIQNSELLNDDNPAIRIMENGEIHIFGTPWSGKTPCYKNIEKKLGAIIKLSQAKENKMRPLSGIESYMALLTNTSTISNNKSLSILLGNHIETIVNTIPLFLLQNLPNKDAAQLCYNTIVKSSKTGQDNK